MLSGGAGIGLLVITFGLLLLGCTKYIWIQATVVEREETRSHFSFVIAAYGKIINQLISFFPNTNIVARLLFLLSNRPFPYPSDGETTISRPLYLATPISPPRFAYVYAQLQP